MLFFYGSIYFKSIRFSRGMLLKFEMQPVILDLK